MALDGAALLVNTTTLGMTGQPPLEIDLALLPKDAVVNDIVYVPLETDLLAQASRRGNPVVHIIEDLPLRFPAQPFQIPERTWIVFNGPPLIDHALSIKAKLFAHLPAA